MKHFFVVLPSDSSMNYFPDNTVAHYKSKLTKPICEDGDYEVALTELVYPMNYHNFVVKEPLEITYPPYRHRINERYYERFYDPTITSRSTWEFESGYFENEEALVKYLNTALSEFYGEFYEGEFEPFFRYNPKTKHMNFLLSGNLSVRGGIHKTTKRVRMVSQPAGLNKAFMKRFNLEATGYDEDGNEIFEPFELGGQHLMYVYSDIVSPYLVGDVQAPLLRVVAPKGERNEIVSAEFTRPYYIPVARRGFDTIEININDELGNPMPFTGGKSVAILHFRKNESVLSDATFG